MEDELRYYEIRMKELDHLLSQAKSNTLSGLISTAKHETEKSVSQLLEIRRGTLTYLAGYRQNNQVRIRKYSELLDLFIEKTNEFKTLVLPPDIRNSLSDFYSQQVTEIQKRLKLEADMNDLVFKTYPFCAQEFSRVLLEMIFKPKTSSFNYETIIDVLNYIAGKLLPGLDELKMVSNFPVSVRKKTFAKSGDKILTYLEQYVDVLEKWQVLGQVYMKILID